jgi:hypothetical protein
MNNFMRCVPIVMSVALLALLPDLSHAKSGPTPHKPNKEFRDLIAKGERPEIAACMVAALDYVRRDATFDAVRLSDDTSDTANLRESESNGYLTRSIRFTTKLRMRGGIVFFRKWQSAEVSCEQRDDASPDVRIKAIGP